MTELIKNVIHPTLNTGLRIEQVSISVVSGLCQLRCIYCPVPDLKRPAGLLDVSLLESVLEQVDPRVVNLQGYGEPSLHPNFLEILRIAKGGGRFVKFFSNLHGWSEELIRGVVGLNANQIIVSVDTFDKHAFKEIRLGGNLDEVLQAARRLIEVRGVGGHPEIVWNCVIMERTVGLLVRSCEMVLELGIGQPVFEMLNDYGINRIKELATSRISEVREALLAARTVALAANWERTLQNIDFNLEALEPTSLDHFECRRPWRLLTVLDTGDVIPCGEFHDGQVVFGNLTLSCLDEVWQGNAAYSFRNQLMMGRSKIPICSRCTVNEAATADLFESSKAPS